MKVIQILHHSLEPYGIDQDPRYYEGDWHIQVGKYLNKNSDYEVECWRPAVSIDEKFVRSGNDEILYRVFPSRYIKRSSPYQEVSISMLNALWEIRNKSAVLQLHGLYNIHFDILLATIGRYFPILCQSHGGMPAKYQLENSWQRLHSLVESYSYRYADWFFCLKQVEIDYFRNFGNAEYQPMGVDFDSFAPLPRSSCRRQLDLSADEKYLLTVSRLEDGKGINYLLDGFSQVVGNLSDLNLIIAGDGPNASNFKAQVERLGIQDSVTFLGWVDHSTLPIWYNAADVVVHPSLAESYGIVPVESFACGTPVIGTDVGNMEEFFDVFGCGMLIDKESSESISEAIVDYFSSESWTINRDAGERKYSWSAIIDNTIDVINWISNQ